MPRTVPRNPMIELENLSRTFGTRARAVHALREVTLELGPGIWAIVGPNGAGKTTLLGLVLGFLSPSAGRVRVGGVSPRQYVRRRGAAYLPERFRVPPEWPVRAALRALARLEGLPGGDADRRADAVVEELGLAAHAERPAGALSRGLNQRLGLAQALLAPRELVVLDEPTEGLDPLWRVRFREIVRDLDRDGRTILLASHELPEVERAADRVVLLQDGRVRDVIDARRPGAGPLRYRLELDGEDGDADAAVAEAFPGAETGPDGATVTVADARDLSARLAALLDRGATLRAVVPLGAGLEERVRQRLEEPPGPEDRP